MGTHHTCRTAVKLAADQTRRAVTDSELLNTYLDMTEEEREQKFADTARSALVAGLSRRTIQFWIEIGLLQAIRVGNRKYKVSQESLRECLHKLLDQ